MKRKFGFFRIKLLSAGLNRSVFEIAFSAANISRSPRKTPGGTAESLMGSWFLLHRQPWDELVNPTV